MLRTEKKIKMAATIPANCTFAHFDCQNTEGISVRWNKYLARSKNMMKAFNITNPDQLLALMLHFGGEDIYDIFESLPEEKKKQESQQLRKTPVRMSSCEAVLLSQTISLQNRTQSIKDMNFADAYNCLQNR